MKATVYVPDALWELASALFPSDHRSRLATRAVGALLRENDGPKLASIVKHLDDVDRERIDLILADDA